MEQNEIFVTSFLLERLAQEMEETTSDPRHRKGIMVDPMGFVVANVQVP